jgi:Protein of unknown function (DUF2634).
MTLPQSNIDLSGGVEFVEQPTLTWNINKETGRIQNTAEGQAAVRQAVEIILNVQRFHWQIFSPYSGVEFGDLIGLNYGYVISELQRRIVEALLIDDRIRSVADFRFSRRDDTVNVSFTVESVFGSFTAQKEVVL